MNLKQKEFKWYAETILGFERFMSQILDIEKNCLLNQIHFILHNCRSFL